MSSEERCEACGKPASLSAEEANCLNVKVHGKLKRCPECGGADLLFHKLGCSRDPDRPPASVPAREERVACKNCGAALQRDWKTCIRCGSPVPAQERDRSWEIAQGQRLIDVRELVVTPENAETLGEFSLYEKVGTTQISDFTVPPGTRFKTPEGLNAEDEECRIAFDAQSGVYPIRESIFQGVYQRVVLERPDPSAPPAIWRCPDCGYLTDEEGSAECPECGEEKADEDGDLWQPYVPSSIPDEKAEARSLVSPGDGLQSCASRMAEWINARDDVPYEVGMAAIEAKSWIAQWTQARSSPAPPDEAHQERS